MYSSVTTCSSSLGAAGPCVPPRSAQYSPLHSPSRFVPPRSGYTAKVAGTEQGVTEPEATFSACFGSAFLMWHPVRLGNFGGMDLADMLGHLSCRAQLLAALLHAHLLRRVACISAAFKNAPLDTLSCSIPVTITPLPSPLPCPPQTKYASMLAEKVEKHGTNVWLINTGWTGGPYGEPRLLQLLLLLWARTERGCPVLASRG